MKTILPTKMYLLFSFFNSVKIVRSMDVKKEKAIFVKKMKKKKINCYACARVLACLLAARSGTVLNVFINVSTNSL